MERQHSDRTIVVESDGYEPQAGRLAMARRSVARRCAGVVDTRTPHHRPSYVRLVSDLERSLQGELTFYKTSYASPYDFSDAVARRYPIALLDQDIEIHFLHYSSEDEARDKWRRRLERFDFANVRTKVSGGKDGFTEHHLRAVGRTAPHPLVLTAASPSLLDASAVEVRGFSTDGYKLFRPSLSEFDLVHWVRSGNVRHAPWYHRWFER